MIAIIVIGFVCFLAGVFVGYVVCAMMVTAADADERMGIR